MSARAIPFARFRSELLLLYKPPAARQGTYMKVRQALDEFSAAGAHSTRDLTPALIARWLASHEARSPAANASIARHARVICRYAVSQGYLRTDPFDWRSPAKWCRLDEHNPIDRHLSPDALKRVLNAAESLPADWAGQRLHALVLTLAYTGLRRNEALGLMVADLDFAACTLEIRANPRRPLKTARSAAVLALPAPLWPVLSRWSRLCGSVWLFPNVTRSGPWLSGRPGHRAYDGIRALGESVGVPGLCFDSFRDTLATLAEMLGLGELELQRLLRHSNPRTQAHYRKAEVATATATAAKLAKLRELAS